MGKSSVQKIRHKNRKCENVVNSRHRKARLLAALSCSLPFSFAASAQTIAPSQVTPRNIAPAPMVRSIAPVLPPEAAAAVPQAPDLAVDTGDVRIEGGFAEMADAHFALTADIAHRHVTLQHLLEAARRMEQAYVRRGFILARVNVPPQRLDPGARVRVVVTDGFIENIDLSHLPAHARDAVRDRLAGLIGKHHVRQTMIERALLLAGDVPGVALRSALTQGTVPGGTVLVIDGTFTRFQAQAGADNALPASLGTWQMNTNLTLNNLIGVGDQLYVTAGSQFDMGRFGFPHAPLGMLGGGLVLPMNDDGITLTSEMLVSRSQPIPAAHVPDTLGLYTRALARLRLPVVRTRSQTLALSVAYENITQSETAIDFDKPLSRDHYGVARLDVNWQGEWGMVPVTLVGIVSQGLSGREPTVALPTSRQGASPLFTHVEGNIHAVVPLTGGFGLDLTARGKSGFGRPLFLSEQFALDAANAVSAFPGGSFTVDSGATLRAEFHFPPQDLGHGLGAAPYVFGAGGAGWIARPTAAEQGYITAGAAGFGGRLGVANIPGMARANLTIGFEFAHQFSNVASRQGGDRASLTAALHF